MRSEKYPYIRWSRSVVSSGVLHRSKSDLVLVGEVTDFGIDDVGRYRADWLGSGVVERAAFADLGQARDWIRRKVIELLGVQPRRAP